MSLRLLELKDLIAARQRSMTTDSSTYGDAASTIYDEKEPETPVSYRDSAVKIPGAASSVADSVDFENMKELEQEPIITTGHDISHSIITTDGDEVSDPCLTFRSFVLGTIIAGLGASLSQIYFFKPIDITVSSVLLLLLTYAIGQIWAKCLPTGHRWRENEHWGFVGRWFDVVNPGPFLLKEHVVATLIATTASAGSNAVNTFAVHKLFYSPASSTSSGVPIFTVVLATFSTACFGYGLVGIMRPLTVYPGEMVYWANLPNILTIQTLHNDRVTSRRLRMFYRAMTGMAIWEIFPQYIFPLLNGISLPCLFTQTRPFSVRKTMTYLFGGAETNEGLGFMELSFDWQYVGSVYMSLPLIQQANSWVGFAICYVAVAVIYYTNAWGARSLPLLSSSLFSRASTAATPILYDEDEIFSAASHTLNTTILNEYGLPVLTGGYVWSLVCSTWAIGALLAHVTLFWGPSIKEHLRNHIESKNSDPHYQSMTKYDETPWWWYTLLLVLAFIGGLVVVATPGSGGTGLGVGGYIAALCIGTFIAPFANLIFARMGSGIATAQLMKMIGGAIHPGQPIANLYFSMWSQDIVTSSIRLGADLKIGQYLKIPPRVMFLTQIWGTIVGSVVNYVVMSSIVASQRSLLLSTQASHVWSGFAVQNINSQAITWSLSSQLFGIHSQYVWVPLGLLLGTIPTTIQYFVHKRYPKIGPISTDSIIFPIIFQYSQWMTTNVSSVIFTTVLVGVLSQIWLRRKHPRWFRKYLYVLGGALDGGTQIMVFILSFAVFGLGGSSRPFPNWVGNPLADANNLDYCVRTNTVILPDPS